MVMEDDRLRFVVEALAAMTLPPLGPDGTVDAAVAPTPAAHTSDPVGVGAGPVDVTLTLLQTDTGALTVPESGVLGPAAARVPTTGLPSGIRNLRSSAEDVVSPLAMVRYERPPYLFSGAVAVAGPAGGVVAPPDDVRPASPAPAMGLGDAAPGGLGASPSSTTENGVLMDAVSAGRSSPAPTLAGPRPALSGTPVLPAPTKPSPEAYQVGDVAPLPPTLSSVTTPVTAAPSAAPMPTSAAPAAAPKPAAKPTTTASGLNLAALGIRRGVGPRGAPPAQPQGGPAPGRLPMPPSAQGPPPAAVLSQRAPQPGWTPMDGDGLFFTQLHR